MCNIVIPSPSGLLHGVGPFYHILWQGYEPGIGSAICKNSFFLNEDTANAYNVVKIFSPLDYWIKDFEFG